MWLFNRKKAVKPKKATSFHEKRLRFPERENEDDVKFEGSSTLDTAKKESWDEDEED